MYNDAQLTYFENVGTYKNLEYKTAGKCFKYETK